MGEQGKVAVITRTKNRPLLLERAIESVLNQTYTNWQMVIVNDGGAREGVDQLVERYQERFAGRVTVLHNDVSGGMENASNQGIRASDSDYVVIHDDDDSWAPNFLKMCVQELEEARKKFASVMGIITDTLAVFERIERGSVVMEHTEPYIHRNAPGLLSFFNMTERNRFPPIAFLYRREVFDTIGYYDGRLPVLGDWDFNLRFMSHYDIYVIPYPLANYHLRPSATGSQGNSTMDGIASHVVYDQYVRNRLLRDGLHGEASQLGLLVNLSQQLNALHDSVHAIPAVSYGGGAPPPPAGAPMGTDAGSKALLWITISTLNFLRSRDKDILMSKFLKHWRLEGSRRAWTVVARWGYLASGGN